MLQPLTIGLVVTSGLLAVASLHHLVRHRLIDDLLMILAAVVEVLLIVQVVVGLPRSGDITDGGERATFIAYLFTVLVVLPVTVFIAIKERSQWAMAIMVAGALVVIMLVGRLQQVWTLNV